MTLTRPGLYVISRPTKARIVSFSATVRPERPSIVPEAGLIIAEHGTSPARPQLGMALFALACTVDSTGMAFSRANAANCPSSETDSGHVLRISGMGNRYRRVLDHLEHMHSSMSQTRPSSTDRPLCVSRDSPRLVQLFEILLFFLGQRLPPRLQRFVHSRLIAKSDDRAGDPLIDPS